MSVPVPTVTRSPADRWSALLVAAGVGLLPWALNLGRALPATTQVAHWNTAWVGLDLLEVAALVTAGVLRRRRDPREPLALIVAGTAVAVDAWFDVTTAATPADTRAALLMLPVELAAVVVTVVLAVTRSRPATNPPARFDRRRSVRDLRWTRERAGRRGPVGGGSGAGRRGSVSDAPGARRRPRAAGVPAR